MRLKRNQGLYPAVLVALLLASCGFMDDKAEAERLAEHYFDVAAGGDAQRRLPCIPTTSSRPRRATIGQAQ